MWEQLHADITQASQEIAAVAKYDDAIFAAFRVVEAKLQARVCSQSIGQALVTEAFDGNPPRIHISEDPRDRQGIQQLFSGALSHIRNDRGHKKAPLTPCESLEDCFLYLRFASFLLYLLAKDKNTFPRIDGVRLLGTLEEPRVELRGVNFAGSRVSVTAGQAETIVVRNSPITLEALLPPEFSGNIKVVVDGKASGETFCDASFLGKRPENYFEILAADVTVYSDANAVNKRPQVVGLLLRTKEGPREFLRIVPTYPNIYHPGFYVSHGPFQAGTSVGETWYRDPVTGCIEYAWTGSMIFSPRVIGTVEPFRFGGISILPKSVQTQVGENRNLRVIGWGRSGVAQEELDVTDKVTWRNVDSSVAFVQRGVLIPKKLGKARAECVWEGFVAQVDISVGQVPRGEQTVYFQGMRGLQQIRFDQDDALYICNQGPSVFRLDKSGGFEEVLRIPVRPGAVAYIDCLAVDRKKNLYVNDIARRAVFKFEWDGKAYVNSTEVARTLSGPKKSIEISATGDVFVTVMGPPGQGWIVRQGTNGEESSFAVKGMPTSLALDSEDNIYVPPVGGSSVLVYRPDGTLIKEIPYEIEDSVCDILVGSDGSIYLACFRGRIMRITGTEPNWHIDVLPGHFGNLGGIAMDSRGRLYVSDFAGDSIHVLF